MKHMIKDAVILFVITLVAGCLLGFVYDVTKEPIAVANEKAKAEAIAAVFPGKQITETTLLDAHSGEAATCVVTDAGYDVAVDEVTQVADASGVLGYAITVTDHEGYGGDIQFTLGVNLDGSLNGISILSIKETVGLGMNAEKDLVPQFANKSVDQFAYTKTGATKDSEVDAISGATVTTNAVVNGVNAGLYYFQNQLMEGGN